MLKFEAKIMNLSTSPGGRSKGGYIDLSSFIKNLPHEDGILNNEIFRINVRGNTITTPKLNKKGRSKHTVYDGVVDTLQRIESGENTDLMFLSNQGCLIMCESCTPVSGKPNTYEIVFSKEHHGFGNGQQSIRSTFYSFHNLGINILPGTCIFVKITEGFDSKESVEICHNNNNSKSINNKDKVSNTFIENGIFDELAQKGYFLKCKKDSDIKEVDAKIYPNGIIDLHDQSGFYNLLNAYHKETPWNAGTGIVDDELLENVTSKIILDVQQLKLDLEKWIEKNKLRVYQYKQFFDEAHLGPYGPIKNLFTTCFKKHYQNFLTGHNETKSWVSTISKNEFFDICFECFESKVPSFSKAVSKKTVKSQLFALALFEKLEDRIKDYHKAEYIKYLEKRAKMMKV